MAFWNKKYTHVSSDVYVSYTGDPKKYYIRDAVLGSLREGMDMGDAIRAAIIDRYAGSPGMIFYYAKNKNILPYIIDGITADPTEYQYNDGTGVYYGDDVNVSSHPLTMTSVNVLTHITNQNPDDTIGDILHYQAGGWDMHFAVLAKCPQSVIDKYFDVGDRLLFDVAWYYTGTFEPTTQLPYVNIISTERVVDPITDTYTYVTTSLGTHTIVKYVDPNPSAHHMLPSLLVSGTWTEEVSEEVETCVPAEDPNDPPVCTTETVVTTVEHTEFVEYTYKHPVGQVLGTAAFFNQPYTVYQACENCSETTYYPGTDGSAKADWNGGVDIPHPELLLWKAGEYSTATGNWVITDDGDGGSVHALLEGRGTLTVTGDLITWMPLPGGSPTIPIGSRCIQAITTTGYYEAFAHLSGDHLAIPREHFIPDVIDEDNDKLLPIFPIMLDKVKFYEWDVTNPLRQEALVLSKRMGMPGKDMLNSLADNDEWDSFDDVHEGYIANILSENTFVAMYVYEFFNQMRLRAEYGPMERFGSIYNFGVTEPNIRIAPQSTDDDPLWVVTPSWDDLGIRRNKLGFETTSGQFRSLLGWNAIEVVAVQGKFSDELLEVNPMHTEVIVAGGEYYVIDELNNNSTDHTLNVGHEEYSQIIIRQQVAGTNIIREIHIFGLVCFNGVLYEGDWRLAGKKIDGAYGNIRELYEDEEANKDIIETIPTQMYIPVSWGIVQHNLTKNKELQVQVMYACKAVMINALTITVNSWWKEKFLPVLIAIIVIVATFYGLGALAQAFAAGMAAGALAVLQMIAIKIAFQTLSSYLIKRFPGTMGKILGAIALVIGDVLSGSFDGSSLMQITAIVVLDVVHAVQESIDNEFKVLQNDIANFEKTMNEANKALEKMQEELYPGAILDPNEAASMGTQYSFIGSEDVETFFQRTTMQDPGDMANESIYGWVDTALQLPEYSGAGKK